MLIITSIIMALFFLIVPAIVLAACRRFTFLGKIGPILLLYIIGIIAGNLNNTEGLASIQNVLSSAMIPLAIPLMLFSCSFKKGETRSQVLALLTGIVAVCLAVVIGYLIFERKIDDGEKVAGLLTGVYTGGTLNLAALKSMLGVSEETYILLNSYDMVISFIYLVFLMAIGIRLFRKILPVEHRANDMLQDMDYIREEVSKTSANPYKGLFTKAGMKDAGFLCGLALLIVGISAGLGLLCGDRWFMIVLILMLTTMGIAASFIPSVRSRKFGYDIGMYLIYVFCIVVASMADLSKMELSSSLNLLAYLTLVIFGSLILQVILARLLRIDSDTMVISSVAFICSPPFVPMMAASMKNKGVLVAGLSIGVIGYAVGNYLGFLIYRLLLIIF